MGNALRFLCGQCCGPEDDYDSAGHHGATAATLGVSVLVRNIYSFEITRQVPQELDKHVVSSRRAQTNWYRKLSEVWRETKPPPKTPEEASRLVVETLKRHQKADVEDPKFKLFVLIYWFPSKGLLSYYGLPLPHDALADLNGAPSSHPPGLKFELHTLPVDRRGIADGDGMTVYVSTTDPRESSFVPREVQIAASERVEALATRNKALAKQLHAQIIDSGYRVIKLQNEDCLARKYRIRLRGIDAPENDMPFGQEAKEELTKIIQDQCLKILVFDEDRYHRWVGDVYCNGIFVQEVLLKKGMAWHYKAYDKRPEFNKWEKQARAKRVGLWSLENPEMPWKWRKDRREGR